MDSNNIRDRKALKRVKLSAGLTAAAVIILILLLALTIRHAREREMVRQFKLQQIAIARGIATRLEDLIISVEKGLLTLATEPDAPPADVHKIMMLHAGMEGKVSFVAVTDAKGDVLTKYPPLVIGKNGHFGVTQVFTQVRESAKPAAGTILMPDEKGDYSRVMVLCVSRYGVGEKFGGVILAALPLATFSEDYLRFTRESSHTWLLDDRGTVLFHPLGAVVGKDVGSLETPDGPAFNFPLRQALLAGGEGSGEYLLRGESNRSERHIVAYAPVRFGAEFLTVAVATLYDNAISPARKTFLIITIGAAVLILVVIITATTIVYAGRRRLYLREIQERLREREDWQEKLIREKRTIEGIIEGSPIPTFVLNRDHKIILWNRACTELTGFEAREMIGTENQYIPFYNEKRPVIADLIIEKDFESIEKYYGTKKVRKSLTVEGAYEARDFYWNLGGQNRYLYFLAAPIHDEKGKIIAAIETIQDVSKEERMAKDLREYAETLQNELQENIRLREEIESLYSYLQSIVDSLPDRLFVVSGDGTIQYTSGDVKDGVGMISRPVKGKNFLEIVTPEVRGSMMVRWEEAKRGVYEPYEIELKAEDGSPRNLLITTGPVRGTDRYLIVQRDITELKKLEERVYESQKMAAVGQLSAGIAHEVRNPLSSIKMSLQILEKRMRPIGNDQKRFKIAEREVEHLEEIVNDVLIFAKPVTPRKEETDIRKVVEHALALAEKGISDKKIQVQTCFADDIPVMMLDSSMLAQAFLNLILNAVDAMGNNGILIVSINAVSQPDGPAVEVQVEDNGCGIGERDMHHLFNPFFTRKKYGTGLGLTQVKKIVELHEGIVNIFSRKGQGTRIQIHFPIPTDGAICPADAAKVNGGSREGS